MTTLLQQAFDEAAKLPAEQQDLLAARLLAELAAEDEFDRAIAGSSGVHWGFRSSSWPVPCGISSS